MKSRLKVSYLSLTVLGLVSSASAYIVKSGDTLSAIAKKEISKHVYGKRGSLNQLLLLNSQIKNPNFIKIGQIINLGKETQAIDNSILKDSHDLEKNTNNTTYEDVKENKAAELEHEIAIEEKKDKKLIKGTFKLNPEYTLFNVSATDRITKAKAIVASKFFLKIKTSYEYEWSDSFQSAIYLRLAQVQFERPTNSSVSLVDSGKFLSSIGFETNYKIKDNLNLGINFDYGKDLFIRANTSRSVTLDAINISTLGLKTSYEVTKLDPFTVGVSGAYSLKFPVSSDTYNVNLGHEYRAIMFIDHIKNLRSDILTELGVSYLIQDTSVTTQSETNIFLGVTFSFGSDKN